MPTTQSSRHPVVIVGAGPIGLITALGLKHFGVDVVVLEEDSHLSIDTKAGTVLTRTLEVLDQYGAVKPVLRDSLRIDEIGELDRETGEPTATVKLTELIDDTRFPFVVNIPQNLFEASLEGKLNQVDANVLRLNSRVTGFAQKDDYVEVSVSSPDGDYTIEADYLLACDGGRSAIRTALDIPVEGKTLEDRYMLVDLKVDLDVANPREYPYLAYFADSKEWMILVRQPHCWRFLYPLKPGSTEPTDEELRDKALHFIGDVDDVEVINSNIYTVHQRVALNWQVGRIFLMGDAAHLITPMWALGLNTGALDASNMSWRLAWVLRGWADPALLDGYPNEQSPVAVQGSGQMAEAARAGMSRIEDADTGVANAGWGAAFTRALLGVRLDIDNTGEWSMVKTSLTPTAVRVGDRIPNMVVWDSEGDERHIHELARDSFVALHFTDARRRKELPTSDLPGLSHVAVSRWDAPHDSGQRDRSYFDGGNRLRDRLGLEEDKIVLIRPDCHIAAIADPDTNIDEIYRAIVRPEEKSNEG